MASTAETLLADLIRCPSVTPETAGAFDVLEAFLVPLGFTVTRLTFEGDGSYPVENLFATRKGAAPGPHLLFAGHTDVVPPGDAAAWSHDPFAADVADGVLWGRGATDMKSGVAAFCAALASLANTNALEMGQISLAITNDEEADAVNGTDKLMAWAKAQGHKFDFAIVGEPSSAETLGDSIKIGRRGSLSGEIVVTGTQGHVAYPEKAANPLPVLCGAALALDAKWDEGTDHFQPSNLEITSIDTGNPTSNVIPARSTLRFNIRFNDTWSAETIEAEIARRLESVDAKGCALSFTPRGRVSKCFLSAPVGHVALLCAIMKDELGTEPALSTGGGTSDARFISDYCPVVECGLVGATMHQIDERVPLGDVERLSALYGRFIARFLSGDQE
ncbi:succinyl-diaminopimelate desuccinylase [Pelagibacterium xiamenense]|uniref:succinyl-diaminopimelate desuccinylase n=1 Tax=Pelagibacterium xiamenense TaxID=2901140 RepID=UPI001E56E374|nr:succinyl-diaminopimelate desuccinylase [Pelagibacterium xiamenense]MCD7058892.1 succinyl-diaminopimelate desuccinylase [Pelagibacterium xiamenense]